MHLILASASPRRKELLTNLGYTFECVKAEVQESSDESLGLEGLCKVNAELKANTVYESLPEKHSTVVIGSDTVVWLEGRSYGKPQSIAHASAMLSALSGKTHRVGTAVTLKTESTLISYCESAEVSFHELSAESISTYIAEVDVMDKAGSYAIQAEGKRVVKSFLGEYECIMGLPLIRLTQELKQLGVHPKRNTVKI